MPWRPTLPYAFIINASTPQWSLPPWPEALALIPEAHPRVLVRPETVTSLQTTAKTGIKRMALMQWRAQARRYIGSPLPLSADKERVDYTDYNARIQQRWSAIADVEETMIPAGELAFMYLLSGDEAMAKEAIRRTMTVTRLDPDGYTSYKVSDFANGIIIRNAAMVYDYTYDLLSPAQKEAIREMLRRRLQNIYDDYRPDLEQRPYQAHAWQQIMTDFMAGALALYGAEDEVPEARHWFHWGLRMFVAFYPWWGGPDGGSAENAAYLTGMALFPSQLNAELIKNATGIDIMQHPWFKGNPYYIIYAHPPGSWRSQFGDAGQQWRPNHNLMVPMTRYAIAFDNPYAQTYALAVGRQPNTFESYLLYFLTAAQPAPPAPRPLSELPKARAFYDVGVVFMHSHLGEPDKNVMFEFKSSPYGSFNHNHADQNTFNIIAYDEILALDSGYYIGYGDSHHLGWTTTTAAHNGLLIDGQGQPIHNIEACGEIVSFFTGAKFHYTKGSAAAAYPGTSAERFLRHILWVEPNAYIIFDQVDTATPTTTEWLLHTLEPMTVEAEERWVRVRKDEARMSVYFAYPEAGTFSMTDQFAVPVPDEPVKGVAADYPNQWHLTAHSPQKTTSHRWLTGIFVDHSIDPTLQAERLSGGGWLGMQWTNSDRDRGNVEVDVDVGADEKIITTVAFSNWADVPSRSEPVAAQSPTPVQIKLAGVSAKASGLAVSQTANTAKDVGLFIIDGTELIRRGVPYFTSDQPLIMEILWDATTGKIPREQIKLYTHTEVSLRLYRQAKPEALLINESVVTEFTWDKSDNYLLLTLPIGNHVIQFKD